VFVCVVCACVLCVRVCCVCVCVVCACVLCVRVCCVCSLVYMRVIFLECVVHASQAKRFAARSLLLCVCVCVCVDWALACTWMCVSVCVVRECAYTLSQNQIFHTPPKMTSHIPYLRRQLSRAGLAKSLGRGPKVAIMLLLPLAQKPPAIVAKCVHM